MQQSTEAFLAMESLSPPNTFFTDKIYEDEIMHPFSDMDWSLTNGTDNLENDKPVAAVAPLSPSLTGEELSNWQLNEVFHDIFVMEDSQSFDLNRKYESVPLATDPSYESGDLLAEAFSLVNYDSVSPTFSTSTSQASPTQPIDSADVTPEMIEMLDVIPLPVFDILHSTGDEPALPPVAGSPKGKAKGFRTANKGKGKSKVKKTKTRGRKKQSTSFDCLVVKPQETPREAIRRVKNNLASRDFRCRKKTKLEDLLVEEERFSTENVQLRREVEMVDEMVRVLQEGLISRANGFHQ